MAIQYSGSVRTSTFSPSTKQNIIDNVETALLAAGWTTISGHATTNLLMQSGTTPQGFAARIRLKDNGGNCVTFSLESTDGSLVGGNSTTVGGAFVQPGTSQTFRIVCSAYQAFLFVTPYSGVNRSFAGFGVPYVPSWVAATTTQLAWMMGDGQNDTDANNRGSFRTFLLFSGGAGAGAPSQQAMYDSVLWGTNFNGLLGLIGLASYVCPTMASGGTGYRWQNNAALIIDPLIAWGDTASNVEAKFKGQLWDAVVSTDAYSPDTAATFDSHNWIVLTNNNTAATLRGSLLLATS